tara:strand:+ start:258 stop:1004 length:747 start_codon:yes stop_codon:yes gene_type:complete
MILYFNGCSFTYGDELVNPRQHSWPALVSSCLKSNFLNDAVSGGTNDRIVYNTVQNINHYDYFFIAWTYYSRFTERNPTDNFEINFNPSLNLDASLHYSDDLKKNYQKYKDYGNLYYKYWFNELYEFKKWLQQIVLLQSFFKVHNKPYLMLNTTGNNLSAWLQPQEKFINATKHLLDFFDYLNDDQLLNEHLQIQELHSMIDKSTFIEWDSWAITDLCSSYPCGKGGHLLEAGHQAVANKVVECYNKL